MLAACLVFSAVFSGTVYSSSEDLARFETLVKSEIVRRSPFLDKARVEISFRETGRIPASAGMEMRIAYPENLALSGDVVVPIELYSGAQLKERVNLRTSIRIFRNVVVATSRIRQGDIFTSKNIGYSERDVTHLPSNYLVDAKKALGRQASTMISRGGLVLDWMPKEVPAVKKGDTVTLFKSSNGILVKVRGVALEDGHINANIRVRNPGSKKIVDGRVVGTGEVEAI